MNDGTNRYLAKAFDDRVGLAIMTQVLQQLPSMPHPNALQIAATVQEELGSRGAQLISMPEAQCAKAVQCPVGQYVAMTVGSAFGSLGGVRRVPVFYPRFAAHREEHLDRVAGGCR